MRAREFLSESRTSLIEGMMTNTEWAKTDTKNKKKIKICRKFY